MLKMTDTQLSHIHFSLKMLGYRDYTQKTEGMMFVSVCEIFINVIAAAAD